MMRMFSRRGFGIQSPWAYSLVRDVLFEPLPYYVFDELRRQYPRRSRRERQADELLFRLAHYVAPMPLTLVGNFADSTREYMRRGRDAGSVQECDAERVIVVADISGENRDRWKAIVDDPSATATFDIRSRFGVAFYKPGFSKQDFKI